MASKTHTVGFIFTFFLIFSFLSLQIEQTFPNTVRTTTDLTGFAEGNITLADGSDVLSNSLNWWDYSKRMVDVFTFGIFMFNSGIMLTLINIFIFFPLRFIFIWALMEVIRGV